MQFRHPEILYTLFFLIIPIIIHLFHLRRFKKVPFTNVNFLKTIELQTRKSSRLKKLLVLINRLLLFTSIILAFSQPFISSIVNNAPTDTYIYLDNSFSMQAKGEDGELLKRATQDIIKNISTSESINLFTNNEVYNNLSGKDIKNTLLSIHYYPVKVQLQTILLKIKNEIVANSKSNLTSDRINNIFLISDFQNINLENEINIDSLSNFYITKLQAANTNNISIDSVYITGQNNESIQIRTSIKNYGISVENLSISLFNEDLLAGKSAVSVAENSTADVDFIVPNTKSFNGKIQIDDGYLNFDNDLFFSIDKPNKINVTAIGENNNFLSKIYTDDDFKFISSSLSSIDYNTLNEQHLLILNELSNIPATLITVLKEFVNKGGSLVIIPPNQLVINNYLPIFKELKIGNLSNTDNMKLAITTINFSHPILKDVFENKVKNFQYPTVNTSYNGFFRNASAILKFENGKNFISQIPMNKGNIYWFSGSISSINSNFKNSPLIVPIFYNFGLYSLQPTQLYYIIGKTNLIEINAKLNKDDVLHLMSQEEDFIPQQHITENKVTITTLSNPKRSGFFNVQQNQNSIKKLAFNYDRAESNLASLDTKEYFKQASNIIYSNSIADAFTTASDKYKTTSLWQLFLILALTFLLTEIVLLKYLKS